MALTHRSSKSRGFSLRSTAILLGALAAACAHAPVASTGPEAAGTPIYLWHVTSPSGQGTQGWLFGSVHVDWSAPPPFDRAVSQAYAQADSLAVELDAVSLAREINRLTLKLGTYPDGTRVSAVIGPEASAKLAKAMAKIGIPSSFYETMRPWLLTMTLALADAQATPARSQPEGERAAAGTAKESAGRHLSAGLDYYFLKLARGNKPILSLETPAQQLEALSSGSEELHVRMLRETLDGLEKSTAELHGLVDAYHAGDDKALTDAVKAGSEDPELQAWLDTIIARRNTTMANGLAQIFESGKSPFAVVGVAHLVGKQSIVTELQAKGFRVERVPRTGEEADLQILPERNVTPARAVTGYRMDWPGEVSHKEMTGENGQTALFDFTRSAQAIYMVTTLNTPASVRDTPPEIYYEGIIAGIELSTKTKLVAAKDITLDGLPARLSTLQSGEGYVRSLVVRVGAITYSATGFVPGVSDPAPEVIAEIDAVLQTFRLEFKDEASPPAAPF